MEEENSIVQESEVPSTEDVLRLQIEELKSKHLYDLAELHNSFNRRVKNVELSASREVEKVILEILEPVDDLERVILHLSQQLTKDDLTGVSHVYKKILGVLRNAGCDQVEVAPGDEFSPALHEAVSTVAGDEPGKVAAVLRNGYRYKNHLIRPAKVVVTTTEQNNSNE